jgi:hypothetical protein
MSAQPPYRPPSSPPPGYGSGRSTRGPVIAAALVVLVIVAGLAYWLGGRNSDNTTSPDTPSPSASASAPAASAAPSVAASQPASAGPSAPPSAGDATSAPATSKSAPTTSASPTKSPSPTVTPFTHPDPDFGYVTGLTTTGSVTKLSFDRATLLTGAAAASAATAHGQPGDGDYFIVNDNPLIRTFELSPSVVVTGSTYLSGDVGPKPSTLAALQAWAKANPTTKLPVDLSYDAAGKVTKIAEVFFP